MPTPYQQYVHREITGLIVFVTLVTLVLSAVIWLFQPAALVIATFTVVGLAFTIGQYRPNTRMLIAALSGLLALLFVGDALNADTLLRPLCIIATLGVLLGACSLTIEWYDDIRSFAAYLFTFQKNS